MSRIFAEGSGVVKEIVESVNTNANGVAAANTILTNVDGTYYIGMGVTGTGIPDNTYITATNLGSNQVTISNAATTTATTDVTFNKTNYDTATNPRFKTFGAYSGSERLYTMVYEQTPPTITDATCDLTNNDATVTCDANANIKVGMLVTYSAYSGIATGTTVASINAGTEGVNVTSFELSANYTGTTRSNQTLTFNPEIFVQQLQGSDSADTEYPSLETTEGYKIVSYDFNTGVGLELSMDANYDYFVLVNSDDYTKHHFAKITTSIAENNTDYLGNIENTIVGFEFEPKLGNEIERNTKFMVFKGPLKTDSLRGCKLLAVSAGIKVNLQNDLVCASPLFYFFNDNLDKDNQLDHNTKYFMKFKGANATTITAGDATGLLNTFVTVSDNKGSIKDYSKYTHVIKVVDNLRQFDYPSYAEASNLPYSLPNEWNGGNDYGRNFPAVFTDYNDCFPNARRDSDLDISSHAADFSVGQSAQVFTGPIRYVHYDFSPTRANKIYNVFDLNVLDSSDNRGSYFDCKMVDNKNMLDSKIKKFEKIRVRHRLHKGKFNDWFALKAKIKSSLGSNEYRFTTEYDLSTMFNVGDEVKIGTATDSPILIIETIDSINNFGTTGKEQDITFRAESRTATGVASGLFASTGYTLPEGDVIYRRAWNTTDKTLLTTFDILENRNNNLYVKLISGHFGFLEATVTAADKNKQMLTLDFPTTSQSSTLCALDYMEGSYYIEVEKFSGAIEKITKTKENGQTILIISGRSDIRKLLGPIINKNTLHSEDIIYSTSSPFERLGNVPKNSGQATTVVCSFDSKVVSYGTGHGLAVGDHIYTKHDSHGTISYIGEVASLGEADGSNDSTAVSLKEFSLAQSSTNPSGEELGLVALTNYYVFNKALSSNTAIDSAATLSGTSTKGLYFTGGRKILSDGSESTALRGASCSTNQNAVGYYMSDPDSILSDAKFQARLDDNANGTTTSTDKTYEDFDTVNTLLDFTVLDSQTDNQRTVVTLAPYLPLTLGRVDINYANTKDTTFNATTLGTIASITTNGNGFSTISVGTSSYNALSGTDPLKYHGEPIYADDTFIGRMVFAKFKMDNSHCEIHLDANVSSDIVGKTVKTISATGNFGETTKQTHELNLLNGGHLHGGKTIGLLHPMYKTLHTNATGKNEVALMNYLFNYKNASNGINQASDDIQSVTYIEKFGTPLYRIYNLEKGNHNRVGNPIGISGGGKDTEFPLSRYYTETLSKVPFYASSYKINFGKTIDAQGGPVVYNSHITGVGKTDKNANNHILPESRGLTNVFGSRFFDTITRHKNANRTDVIYNGDISKDGQFGNAFISKAFLYQIDPKVNRMFLFANSDREPYSAKRHDSLMLAGKDITNYNFFGLSKPALTTLSETKESSIGLTHTLNLTDDDYVSSGIVSSSKTLSSLSRFSLMRLTEVVIDWAFNQIDPENIVSSNRVMPYFTYASYDWALLTGGSGYWQSSTNDQVEVADYSGATLTADADLTGLSLVANDIIADSNGRIIGLVQSVGGAGNTVITFQQDAKKTNLNAYFVGDLYRIKALKQTTSDFPTENSARIIGRGKETTAFMDRGIHMLKSIVVNDVDEYGKSGSPWHDGHSHTLEASARDYHELNTMLPIAVFLNNVNENQSGSLADANIISGSAKTKHPFTLFANIDNMDSNTSTSTIDVESALYNGFLPLFLDDFDIENGGGQKGNPAEKGMVGQPITSTTKYKIDGGLSAGHIGLFGMKTFLNYAHFDSAKNAGNATTGKHDSTDKETAQGVMLSFKPRLYFDETGSAIDSAGNREFFHYIIDVDADKTVNHFDDSDADDLVDFSGDWKNTYTKKSRVNRMSLRHINDLTGCYLVSEKGKYLEEGAVVTNNLEVATPISLDEVSPTTIAYVVSHEIETTNTNLRHNIITDKALPNGFYRIMQPNHTCFYDFSPKEIVLNTLSSKYTKRTGEKACYENINSYITTGEKAPRQVGNFKNTGGNEAALSMYVVADIDRQSSNGSHVVLREGNHFEGILDAESYDMCVADGNTHFRSLLQYINVGLDIGHTLKFSEMKEQLGVVSISEVFDLTLSTPIKIDLERGMIGSSVAIANEAEDLINELLEEQGIVFENTSPEYPVFISPNYQGVDLFSAVNFLLKQKDKTIFHDNNTFKIKPREDSFFDTGIIVTDSSDVELYDYERKEDLFNLKNEIAVYGSRHKAVRSDFTSIEEDGKKSLEIYDEKLTTQDEVNLRADEELAIHTSLNENITIEVGHKHLSQVIAGDLIELEIARDNIKRNKYQIIQNEHLLTGNMRLQLGRYSKVLEDRFAELAIEARKLRNATRDARFDESNTGRTMFDKIKIKPIRLVVRERGSSGGAPLGFGTPLNTSTRPLGHEEGMGVTYTTLLEEEY